MRSMADCLQEFFDNLIREGIDLPTTIQFRKKDYWRLESEMRNSPRLAGEGIIYLHGAGNVLLTRKKCEECGE